MSYILDALRKSDQLRRRGAAPTLLLGQAPAAAPKRPAPLAYGLFALVLLGAGIGIGWMHPWQRQPAAPAPPAGTARPPAATQNHAPAANQSQVPLASLAPKPQPEVQARISAPAAPHVPARARAAAPAPAQVASGGQPRRKSGPSNTAASAHAQAAAPVQPASGATVPSVPVTTMSGLPLAIQQELPQLSVSVHAYSPKPADRLVDINGRLLHEGETVAPGLQLEQITPEGMILSYKGYTFSRGVR